MYEHEDDFFDNSPLYNHVKKEKLLSKTSYKELMLTHFCDEDTDVYRGFSFRTKKEYEKFKEILDNGDYKPLRPESFSRDLKTAESFSRNKKTFFFYQDHNIALEHTYKNITNESISVYAGIVLKTTIPKGKGVDVNKSNVGIEDEIIYQSNEKIDYSYNVIQSYEDQLKEKPIDLNLYIQEKGIKDELSKYILSNHQLDLNKETELFILDDLLKPLTLKKGSVSYYINEEDKNLVATELNNSLNDDNKIKINFHFGNILKYYKMGVFKEPTVLAIMEEHANKIIENVCDFIESEYNYSDREEFVYYNISDVTNLSHLAGEEERRKLKSINWMTKPKSYDELNNDIRELNYRDDLTSEEKDLKVKNIVNEIKDFILTSIENNPVDKNIIEKEIDDEKINNKEVKDKIKKLRNS